MDTLLEGLERGLGDAYRIDRELGGGGMSRVFLARDTSLDRPVVVKVLSPEASEGTSAERFRREVQLIAKLQHPHIVPIIAASQVDGMLYYVMPFVAGDSLRARLSRDGPLPVREVVRVMRDVVGALGFAHGHGVIHRDIKPENILLEAGHSLVADFGVAKALRESTKLTSTGISIGTPAYMAPEQVVGDSSLDQRADLYAVAVVAYEMLVGAPPFAGSAPQIVAAHLTAIPESIARRRPDVPPALADLIMRALEKDPAKRPQSADEMLSVLDSVATPEAASVATSSSVLKRFRVPIVAAAGLAAMTFGGWRLARPAVVGSAQSIAIVPFSVADGDTALVRLSQNLVTLVSNNLDGVGEIRVADPIAVLSHARSVGHAVVLPDAMGIARALRAKSAVYGTLARSGATVRIDVGLYDVSAPDAPLARVSVSAPPDSVEALTDSLTMGLLRQVWSKGRAPTPHVTSITTHSPVALREFLDGERRFMHGDVFGAGDAYRRAVAADTTFWFAAYRYGLARAWKSQPEDTSIARRLDRHRADLPERERALLAVSDSSPTQSEQLRRLEALTARYPEYAPAWEQMADLLTHHFIRSGHSVAEAIEPWRRVAALMPADLTTADHLVFVCLTAGDLECARQALTRFDSLVRADPAADKNEVIDQRLFTIALKPASRARLDSILGPAMRDSAIQGISPSAVLQFAPALVDQPEALSGMDEISRRILALPSGLEPPFRRSIQSVQLLARATRGDWGVLDSADAVLASGPLMAPLLIAPLDMLRARVLGELQGAIPPSPKTLAALQARIDDTRLSPGQRAEARWLLGASALVRRDSSALRGQLTALSKDTLAEALIATRSLRALDMGFRGQRAVAAESLLVLERVHGEYAPKVWGAFDGDRLFAAQWLTEAGKPAPADSLLEFTRGYLFGPFAQAAWPVFASAQLQRSRIAEAMGRRDDAVRYATIFVRAYDLAPADHRSQLEEAAQRIERLGRNRDTKTPQKIP